MADNIYTKASVDNTGTVCIWLGANVMVEYTYDEAIALLQQNYDTAAQRLVYICIIMLYRKILMKI